MPEIAAGNRVFIDGAPRTWRELSARAENNGLVSAARSSAPSAIVCKSTAAAFEAAAAMASHGLDGLILEEARYTERIGRYLEDSSYFLFHYPGALPEGRKSRKPGTTGRVGLLTSGSTGTPKLVFHTWRTLFSAGRCRSRVNRRWLVPYQAGTYAWYQLVTLGLFQPGQDLVPLESPTGLSFIETAIEHRVDSFSATPTLWRLALLTVPRKRLETLQPAQITLGGELVDQALLDRLHDVYPGARITQIYASSEAGACIVVQDGKPGFPAAWLEDGNRRPHQLKIEENRLWVRSTYSANAAAGRGQDWVDTGDFVEVRNGRARFLGRAETGLINVGGAKVIPADVEAVLLQHPAVSWCRVKPVPAPIVGYLPEVDFVLQPGCRTPTETELVAYCRDKLPEESVPRFWNRLDSIPLQRSLKAELRGPQ